MNFDKAAREILHYLFAEYIKGPAVNYTINGIAKKLRVDVMDITDYMLEKGWIRERWIYSSDAVGCKITIRGIEQVESAWVRERLRQVIGGLGEAGGSKDLVEILQYKIEEYSIALDIVRQLENLGLIVIKHPRDSIVIELTEEGRRSYEKGSQTFFTLMSY